MSAAPDAASFDSLLTAVGRLNYTWTNTESLLIHLIAGLSRVDKETAVVIFLTLNTARARIDLVERLAKLGRVSAEEREEVLEKTRRIHALSALRNRYNHCIYAFDPESGTPRTILMRIADRKDHIKMGQVTTIDDAALKEIDEALKALSLLNHDIWSLAKRRGYPL